MFRKTAAPLLVCASLLFNFAPPKAVAQTSARSRQPAEGVTQATPKPDLKAAFGEGVASAKLRTPTAAEYMRLDAARQQQAAKSGLSKNDKILLVVFAVSMTVLIIALVKHGIEPSTSCSEDPSDPFCT
jgi:hypothetical protein